MNPFEHQAEHIRLHHELDVLLACYLSENPGTSIHDEIYALMKWSHQKTLAPSPAPGSESSHPKREKTKP